VLVCNIQYQLQGSCTGEFDKGARFLYGTLLIIVAMPCENVERSAKWIFIAKLINNYIADMLSAANL